MKFLILSSMLFGTLQSVCERPTATSPSAASPVATSPAMDQKENKMDSKENLEKICQLTLDLPKLQAYFHSDRPGRKPLQVVDNDQVTNDLKLEKFGEPVKFVSAADLKDKSIPAFEFTSVKIEGPSALVQFRYRVEGIRGKASFKSTDGKWEVVSSELSES